MATEMSPAQEVSARAVAAVVGALVADAAAQGLHWVYDLEKLDAAVGGKDPEFHSPSACPFYTTDTGTNTAYGDQTFVLLESLAQCKGLDVSDLQQRFYKFFGPGTAFDTGDQKTRPIKGPWRNGSIKAFLASMEAKKENTGSDTDTQADGAAKVAPLVALYAGQPDMLAKVEAAVRVTQNHQVALSAALANARILEAFILNGKQEGVVEALMEELGKQKGPGITGQDETVLKQIREVQEQKPLGKPHREVVNKVFGSSCALPKQFQAALHCVLTHTDYVSAVRATILAGGDNASRAGFVGACFGALGGLDGIPTEWKEKCIRYQTVLDLAQKLAAVRET
ncbi:PREDICTED: crystallin J1A-like [Branchiostoma belcheri]|uniref:Crystallin J1A-like n=1 Tax=Branchiostoma belcheri TaxID=7741 RepID=A0A6P5A286_BRABE|nr:PREDICTED: crystallin J1A-like [Branchiostoma belcheri]